MNFRDYPAGNVKNEDKPVKEMFGDLMSRILDGKPTRVVATTRKVSRDERRSVQAQENQVRCHVFCDDKALRNFVSATQTLYSNFRLRNIDN